MEILNMRKIMKSSTIKTIIVSLDTSNIHEIDVDANIFDDVYMEAATRAVEKCNVRKYGIIRPIISCWDKKDEPPKRKELINSYWVLVNAAAYKLAELIRERFKTQSDKDLAKEPVRARTKAK